jgi:hypothetical protein
LLVYRAGKQRAGEEAFRFSGIEGQQQLLRGLVTSLHEITTGLMKVLQGTAGLRFTFTAGHCDLLLRAKNFSIKAFESGRKRPHNQI